MKTSNTSKWLAGALAVALFAAPVSTAQAATTAELTGVRDGALNYLRGKLAQNNFRYVMDWPALTIYAAGESPTGARWTTAAGQNGVTWREADLKKNLNITDATTDFESTLLGALAAGKNPRAYGRRDLVQAVVSAQQDNGKFADTIYGFGDDLLNPHLYGIISLYAAGVEIPNKQKAADYLLSKQHADGGFNWSNGNPRSDADVTAMALIAMKALGLEQSHASVQKALGYLKQIQSDFGGFKNEGVENPDSSSIVTEALLMHDIDPTSWKKGSGDVISSMLAFRNADGAFAYAKGTASNILATQNVALALSDYLKGESVYEQLHDQNAGKSGAWKPLFADLPFSHPYYEENIALVNLGVVVGHTNGTYGPNDNVSREQFSTILVNGQHLQDQVGPKITRFRDVKSDRWSNPYIAVAYKNKFIFGTSDTTFDPAGNVTGAQVMAILVRMLGLESEALARPNQKNWYDGHIQIAKEQGLWYPAFDPKKNASRAEVGYAFMRYYDAEYKKGASN
ncbi:S-layer family protein [Tumebacillus sp. BK434]|uniref:S-layer homology domain-containing protein n=1 Tax=Tumebacillus sp. BK434 TaxID=2512169 RepID=UPI0010442B3F|nr:S-layer homology domain-containing protein [Tumebacillus sp. BK434]TCP53835.1 S-layer family protein [Tumebacillus sp. BK434]